MDFFLGNHPYWKLYIQFVLCVGLNFLRSLPWNIFGLESICCARPFDFILAPPISIHSAISKIPATSLESFGNLNKASTTYICKPPKKTFLSKLVHVRCNIHFNIKIVHIGLKKPRVPYLHEVHSLPQFLILRR